MALSRYLFDPYFSSEDYLWPLQALANPFVTRHVVPPQQRGVSEVVNTDKEFRVNVDVQHFQPNEIDIKTKGNRLIVNAHHEERPDEHGFIMREFTRQYVLPKDVDPDTVTSTLSREGVLTMKAPKMALEAPKERVIPITHVSSEQDEPDQTKQPEQPEQPEAME